MAFIRRAFSAICYWIQPPFVSPRTVKLCNQINPETRHSCWWAEPIRPIDTVKRLGRQITFSLRSLRNLSVLGGYKSYSNHSSPYERLNSEIQNTPPKILSFIRFGETLFSRLASFRPKPGNGFGISNHGLHPWLIYVAPPAVFLNGFRHPFCHLEWWTLGVKNINRIRPI